MVVMVGGCTPATLVAVLAFVMLGAVAAVDTSAVAALAARTSRVAATSCDGLGPDGAAEGKEEEGDIVGKKFKLVVN